MTRADRLATERCRATRGAAVVLSVCLRGRGRMRPIRRATRGAAMVLSVCLAGAACTASIGTVARDQAATPTGPLPPSGELGSSLEKTPCAPRSPARRSGARTG